MLWCYDDVREWGRQLCDAAKRRDRDARMFEAYHEPDAGHVFFNMHNHPSVRDQHKRVMQHFATIPSLTLIPSYSSSFLFDNKLEQLRHFTQYIPVTHVFQSPAAARRFLQDDPKFPLVSKASEGGGASNVRLLETFDDAKREIKLAFSDLGIKCHFGHRQRGYLMWQQHIEGIEYDLRIVRIGDEMIGIRRRKKEGYEFAHSNGDVEPLTCLMTDEPTAYVFAQAFFTSEKIRWGCIDIVQGIDGGWKLLKFNVTWEMAHYMSANFHPSGRAGKDVWDVVLDQIDEDKL